MAAVQIMAQAGALSSSMAGSAISSSPSASSFRGGSLRNGQCDGVALPLASRRPGSNRRQVVRCIQVAEASASSSQESNQKSDPLLVRAARGEPVPRQPAWMMRQAGRYQQAYRTLAEKFPSFRQRSEETDLIVEISLQPWNSFKPDGVILFSDILTPLPSMGVPFEIDDIKGPILDETITGQECLKRLRPITFENLSFVGESLSILRNEVGDGAAVLGFVGSPWTLATYVVEGRSSRTYTKIKRMAYTAPDVLHGLLEHLAQSIGAYCNYQIESGAQCIQIFDSWGGQLTPRDWDRLSKPYIEKVVAEVRAKHPTVPLTLYANGSGGLLERLGTTGVDVIGLDWTLDMADARKRLGQSMSVQGNVDPAVLFATEDAIEEAVRDCITKSGGRGHILNLGHGVLVGTPEESVAHFFNVNRSILNKNEIR